VCGVMGMHSVHRCMVLWVCIVCMGVWYYGYAWVHGCMDV